MTSLYFLVGVKITLIEISVCISQLANLRISQFLKYSGSLVPHNVLTAVVAGLRQQAFILSELRLLQITTSAVATNSVTEVYHGFRLRRLGGCREPLTQRVSSKF